MLSALFLFTKSVYCGETDGAGHVYFCAIGCLFLGTGVEREIVAVGAQDVCGRKREQKPVFQQSLAYACIHCEIGGVHPDVAHCSPRVVGGVDINGPFFRQTNNVVPSRIEQGR